MVAHSRFLVIRYTVNREELLAGFEVKRYLEQMVAMWALLLEIGLYIDQPTVQAYLRLLHLQIVLERRELTVLARLYGAKNQTFPINDAKGSLHLFAENKSFYIDHRYKKMNIEDFWNLIEHTGSRQSPEGHSEAIQRQLSEQPPREIQDFDRHMRILEAASYTWDIWGAAYLINGGCSDDGFDYFRGWLILQGKTVFEKALQNPDSLADLPGLEEDVECEDVLYVARQAYESVTGNEMPLVQTNLPPLGDDWDFDNRDEMKSRYPKLFTKFGW